MKSKIANQTSPTAFQFLCMALAIEIVLMGGALVEAHHELLPKKSKVMLYLLFSFTVKPFNQLYKMEFFSFNSGHAVRVGKFIKEDWSIVL